LGVISGQTISNDFKFCPLGSKKLIDIDIKTCQHNYSYNGSYDQYCILQQRKFNIEGIGYQCEITRVIARTFRPLFAPDDIDYFTEKINITAFECWKMVNEHR